jgi:hypothetical protein
MKKFTVILISLVLIFLILFSYKNIIQIYSLTRNDFSVLILYNPNSLKNSGYVLDAYKSVLDEEGVIHRDVNVFNLITLDPVKIVRSKNVILFPDGVNQYLPIEVVQWIEKYLENGGNVFFCFDPGIKNFNNAYLDEGLFSHIICANYITYKQYGTSCFTTGYLYIDNKNNQDFLGIPYWKLIGGHLLGGYSYGKFEYPVAVVDRKENLNDKEIYAFVNSKDGKKYPGVIIKKYQKGAVMYVNLPLGYLKSYADDFPLRTFLRTFLFKVVKIPHLVNVPYGTGGLVVNWHVDSSIDWKSIPYMIENNYLRKGIEYSIDITAGDFRDKPGDGLGFDACGKGKDLVRKLAEFGIIGSHGGWGHNFFSNNIMKGVFGEKEIYEYILKNNQCLESITGYKITEYAAPNGVHPQPLATKVLEKLGTSCYYYTGDNGSSPNRTFINGKMVSDKVVAFPISSLGKDASFFEMKKAGKTEEDVKKWLIAITDYVSKEHTVRLIYSHPYDIPLYPDALKGFLDYLDSLQKQKMVQVKPMSYFANFLFKLLNTKFEIDFSKNKISLSNKENLEGITIAVPKNFLIKDLPRGLTLKEDSDYQYITITKDFDFNVLDLSFYISK